MVNVNKLANGSYTYLRKDRYGVERLFWIRKSGAKWVADLNNLNWLIVAPTLKECIYRISDACDYPKYSNDIDFNWTLDEIKKEMNNSKRFSNYSCPTETTGF